MIQQVTSYWSFPRLPFVTTPAAQTGKFFIWLCLLLGTATGLRAGNAAPPPLPGDTTITATICANETYEFNGQILDMTGEYSVVLTASDGTDSLVTLQLTVLPLGHSTTDASICAGETYDFFGESLDEAGTYEAGLTGDNGCDSIVTLHLSVLQPSFSNISAAICTGSYYLYQSDTLRDAGTYMYIFTAANGCDSIVRLVLEVVDYFDVEVSASICKGETYLFGGLDLDMDGVYVDSLKAVGGCDSIVTLTLNILLPTSSDLFVNICDGSYYVFHGDTLNSTAVYTYTETGSNGCDSLVNLHLQLVPYFETPLEATICDGETLIFGSQELTTEGVYIDTLTASGGCDSILVLSLKVLPLSSGNDGATICAGDTYEYNGSILTEAGDYQFVLTGSNGCDSTVTFTLTVLESPVTSLDAVVCHGESFTFYGQQLTESGEYHEVFEAANGCDSTVVLHLTVLDEIHVEVNAAICSGQTYDFNGDILSESGTYSQVLTSEHGCDSTVVLTLTVHPLQSTTLDVTLCAGQSYIFDGIAIAESGTYKAVYADVNGCDSTVTLNLTVLEVKESSLEVTICDGTSYEFNGASYTDEGVYTAVLQGEYGCDSTVTLTLHVLPTSGSTIDASICEGGTYDYFGQILTEAGTYEFNMTGANGCDSVVVINLTVLQVQHSSLEAAICNGGSYEYDGVMLTEAGSYDFTYLGSNGCDSVVTVKLTVHPTYQTTLGVTLCAGLSYTFDGADLTDSGTYTAQYNSVNGCDSTVTLNLNFISAFDVQLSATICSGGSFDYDGHILTEAGDYTYTYQAVGGCDSTVTLTLTVLPTSGSENSAQVCAGTTYDFNGQTLTESGTYSATLTAENGCDSVAVLHLTVLPLASASIDAAICAGTSYDFGGETLTESGIYTSTEAGANGCDSTTTLNLTVLPDPSTAFEATICAGDSYSFNGQSYTESGTYSATYIALSGCDSVSTLVLTVQHGGIGVVTAHTCNGESYPFHGETLTESGTYSFTLDNASANGCDSLVVLTLTIYAPIPPTTVNATICEGETYNFNGDLLTSAGQYVQHIPASNGCDSTVVLTLAVNPNSHSEQSGVLCNGESILFNGTLITQPGTYTFTVQNYLGCDSVITFTAIADNISVSMVLNNGTLTATATGAVFYQWVDCLNVVPISGANGPSYTPTTTGVYAIAVVSANGCTAVSGCVTVVVVGTKEPLTASGWTMQPNPATDQTNIILKEPAEGPLTLEVFDPAGRLIVQEEIAAGSNTVELRTANFPAGMLWVRLKGAGGASTKALNIQR